MRKMFKAYSMAEVLIALTIIGVIAAMTIPALQQNAHKREIVVRVNKAHSILSQAVSRMENDYGGVGRGANWTNEQKFWTNFTQYLNTMKICKPGEKGCFTEEPLVYLNGAMWGANSAHYTAKLADGMGLSFSGSLCTEDKGVSADDIKNGLGRFLVDVNGEKGPNKFGEDEFFFCLVKFKGIVPAGSDNYNDCKKGGGGVSCAAKVIKEGKIDYLTKTKQDK